MRSAAASTVSADGDGGSVTPGSTGTPAAAMSSLACTFEPILAIAAGGGPTNTRPASVHAVANPACSDRKP